MRVNPEFLRRGYLKKQSQFAGGQIGVNSYLKGKYGNMAVCGTRKTKPKQSQFQEPTNTPKQRGNIKRSRPDIAISLEESLKGRTLLFLDFFAPVLDIGLAHPHVRLYGY